MIDSFFQILNRLDRIQKGPRFCMVSLVLGLLLVIPVIILYVFFDGAYIPADLHRSFWLLVLIHIMVWGAIAHGGKTLTVFGIMALTAAISIPCYFGGPEWFSTYLFASGIGSLVIWLIAGLEIVRMIFGFPWPPLAIARLLIDEAIRMKIAIVFIIAVIVFIPLVASRLDPSERLEYRIQSFLSYGTGVSYGLLAVMTVFVSTASVAFEQRDKQIFQIITKPVSHFQYLFGKWLGVMGLNLILLSIVGGSVFVFVQALRQLPAVDQYDRLAVTEQVLTARVGVSPHLSDVTQEAVDVVRRELEMDPDQRHLLRDQKYMTKRVREEAARMHGAELTVASGGMNEYLFENVRPVSKTMRVTAVLGDAFELSDAVKSVFDVKVFSEDRSIQYAMQTHYLVDATRDPDLYPAEIHLATEEGQKGLEHKISNGQRLVIQYFPANALTLRFKLNAGDNDPGIHFPVTFIVPSLGYTETKEVALVQMQTFLIPAGAVEDDGRLYIQVINGRITSSPEDEAMLYVIPNPYGLDIKFPPDGFSVMYKVSQFESNYLRAMLIMWMKLGFLAMLGIAAATFSSFPVACMLAFVIFFGAETGPYLAEALEYYEYRDAMTDEINYIKLVISVVATGVNWLLRSFGELKPTQNLIEGRLVSWALVSRTFGQITLVWTGLAMAIGWVVFRSRQLAIYSGQG